MAAYAALVSLENTIHRILNHHHFSVSLPEEQQIVYLLDHVNSFQGFLEEFPNAFNSLEGRMKELAHETEDILEYLVLEKVFMYSQDKNKLELETVREEIDVIAREVEKIKGSSSSKDLQPGLRSYASPAPVLERIRLRVQGGVDSSARISSSANAPSTRKDIMVGFEDYVIHVMERLCEKKSQLQVIPICGMGASAKLLLPNTFMMIH